VKTLIFLCLCALYYPAFADWRLIGRLRYGLPQLPPPVQPQSPQQAQPRLRLTVRQASPLRFQFRLMLMFTSITKKILPANP